MPVIINTLEVQVPQSGAGSAGSEQPAAVPVPPAVDIAETIRHRDERALRTEAS